MLGRLSLAPGSLFAGQFRVIQPIASGGMGTVYRVEQVGTGQQRALKVMNGDLVDDPRARERFTREAQMAAMIESEHVAQVLAAGIDPEHDTPWMLLELLRGEDLSRLLERRGRLPLGEALEIFEAARPRARGGAPPGHRPPRPEAREHLRRGVPPERRLLHGEGARLRHRQGLQENAPSGTTR